MRLKKSLNKANLIKKIFSSSEESFVDALLDAKGITVQEDDYYYHEESCLKYRVYIFYKNNDLVTIGFIGHNDQYSSYQVTRLVNYTYYGCGMVYDIQPD